MLGIQLEALSIAEVRRLLELARARGQEGLARQLEAELASRPGRSPGRPLAMAAPQPSPQPQPRRMAPARPQPAPVHRRRRSGAAIAVAGVAGFIGAALAWGVSLTPQQAPPRQALAVSNTTPPPRIAVALTTTAAPEKPSPAPVEDTSTPAPVAELPREAHQDETTHSNPCLDLATAQERLVCGYPSLAILDRRMKSALDRARANGSDVKAIEDAQASWQRGSANVSDRLALGDRYSQRIAELESE